MKIMHERKEVPGVFQLDYRGFTISLSNTMASWGEGAVFDKKDKLMMTFEANMEGLVKAKLWIDRRHRSLKVAS